MHVTSPHSGPYSSFQTSHHSLVQNPPEFLPGVSQDVTCYVISVGVMDSMTIPASTACSTSTCFHSYSVQSLNVFSSPLSASVSAVNVIGRGQVCTPQTDHIGMYTGTETKHSILPAYTHSMHSMTLSLHNHNTNLVMYAS